MDSGYRGTLIGSGGNNAINPTNVEVKLFESYNGGKEIKTNDDIITFSTNAITNINAKLNVLNDVSINGLVNIGGSLKVNDVQLSSMGVNGNMNVSGVSVLQNVTVVNKSTLRDVSVNGIMDVSGTLTCKNTNVNGNLNVSGTTVLQNINVANKSTLRDVSVNGIMDVSGILTCKNTNVNGNLNVTGSTVLQNNTVANKSILQDVSVNGIMDVSGILTCNNLHINGTLSGVTLGSSGKPTLLKTSVILTDIILNYSAVGSQNNEFNVGTKFPSFFDNSGQWKNDTSIISVNFTGYLGRTQIVKLYSYFKIETNVELEKSVPQGFSKYNADPEVFWSTNECKFEINSNNKLILYTLYNNNNNGSGTTFSGQISLLVY